MPKKFTFDACLRGEIVVMAETEEAAHEVALRLCDGVDLDSNYLTGFNSVLLKESGAHVVSASLSQTNVELELIDNDDE